MDDEFVRNGEPDHLCGGVLSRDPRRTAPGARVAPCLGQCLEVVWDAAPPIISQLRGISGWRSFDQLAALLPRGCREGKCQTADVIDQIADGVRRAGRRLG